MNNEKKLAIFNVSVLGLLLSILVISTITSLGLLKFIEKDSPQAIDLRIENGMALTMEATGYAIGHPYSTITKSGQPVISRGFLKVGSEEIFTVAVDPKIIPLGSLLYLEGIGIGLAQDTGPKIVGTKIDICFKTMDEAMKFGKVKIKVILIKNGRGKEEK